MQLARATGAAAGQQRGSSSRAQRQAPTRVVCVEEHPLALLACSVLLHPCLNLHTLFFNESHQAMLCTLGTCCKENDSQHSKQAARQGDGCAPCSRLAGAGRTRGKWLSINSVDVVTREINSWLGQPSQQGGITPPSPTLAERRSGRTKR